MNITAADRTALLDLAASLPKGDETRRAILAGLQRVAADDKVKVLNENGREVWVTKETLSGPDKVKYKPVKDKEDGGKKPSAKAPAHLSSFLGVHKKLFEDFLSKADLSEKDLEDEGSLKSGEYGKWTGQFPSALEEFAAEHPNEADEVMVAWASKKTGIPKAKLQDPDVFSNDREGIRIDPRAARK